MALILSLLFIQAIILFLTVILTGTIVGIDTFFIVYLFIGLVILAIAILYTIFRAYKIGIERVCPPLLILLWLNLFLTLGVIITQCMQLHQEESIYFTQNWWLILSLTSSILLFGAYLESSFVRNTNMLYARKEKKIKDIPITHGRRRRAQLF